MSRRPHASWRRTASTQAVTGRPSGTRSSRRARRRRRSRKRTNSSLRQPVTPGAGTPGS
ncbi:hypothetical protein ACFPRL_17150 [Pseudoclavibacter helvolus]